MLLLMLWLQPHIATDADANIIVQLIATLGIAYVAILQGKTHRQVSRNGHRDPKNPTLKDKVNDGHEAAMQAAWWAHEAKQAADATAARLDRHIIQDHGRHAS